MFMVQVEYLALILTGIGIIVSILYYASVLRNANKTQQMQLETRQLALFMPLFETYRSREFRKHIAEMRNQEWTSNEDFVEKYGPDTNPDAWSTRVAVGSYFDGIGVLVRRGHVDIGMVNDLIGNALIDVWEQFGPVFLAVRTRNSNPYIYTDYEWLYEEIVKYREEHPIPDT